MGGSSFDVIVQEIMKQQRIMEHLEEENCELRRQLADLRDGRGIFLDIHGKRYALIGDTIVPGNNDTALVSLQHVGEQEQEEQPAIQEQPTMQIALYDTADAPTEAMSELTDSKVVDALPPPEQDAELDERAEEAEVEVFTVDDVMDRHFEDTVDKPTHSDRETPIPISQFTGEDGMIPPPFLEELMIDEFTATASNPKAVWTPPQLNSPRKQTKKLEMDDEEAKAALRRELIGSFLLE